MLNTLSKYNSGIKGLQDSWWRTVDWKYNFPQKKVSKSNFTSEENCLRLNIKFTENKKNKSRCWWRQNYRAWAGAAPTSLCCSPTADCLFQLFMENTSCCSWWTDASADTSPLWFSSPVCRRHGGPANSSAADCVAMIESVCRRKNQLSAPTPTSKLLHFSRELFYGQAEGLKLAAGKCWMVPFGSTIKVDCCNLLHCLFFTPILS